ncbi:hypothetical protein CTAYLR_001520 [Chrysophaeum taylorii]|uniref:Arf-GAP domain-containing protein n=1 Tax=Chrysophaeum taylorii TaxID=2483200 RepID=A0AAD7XIJ7_9STRA|nr:hypothetical protein CTAYLR_001520 [Chrysophaeum taylorii]
MVVLTVPVAERRAVFKKLLALPDNRVCFDCPQKKPMWASSTFGVFICLDCAGGQRRLGTHLTFVRSVDMDEWTPEQLEAMKLGGNKRARLYFRDNGVMDLHQRQDLKYSSSTAKTYRTKLQREVQASLDKGTVLEKEQTKKEKKEEGDGLHRLMQGLEVEKGGEEVLPKGKKEEPPRATSAPELAEYGKTPPEEEGEKVSVPTPKKAPPEPKGTLSAGMLLGAQRRSARASWTTRRTSTSSSRSP